MATELAVGMAIAQQIVQQQGGGLLTPAGQTPQTAAAPAAAIPELLTPDQVAEALGVSVEDVLAVIESGELKAKKIGSSHRIKRSAVDAFLAD